MEIGEVFLCVLSNNVHVCFSPLSFLLLCFITPSPPLYPTGHQEKTGFLYIVTQFLPVTTEFNLATGVICGSGVVKRLRMILIVTDAL